MSFQFGRYTVKRAETAGEFEQIHALNYATFVHEIRQHEDPGHERLVDKFHDKSQYFIVLRGDHVVGMISLHDQPPFSVASRLPDPQILEATGVRPLEVRLLAIEPGERHSAVLGGLLWGVYEHVLQAKYTHLFISAFEDRLGMYSRLGFEPLGPPVLSGQARFVPMCISVSRLAELHSRLVGLWEKGLDMEENSSS
jgi:hypothetical protein